MTDEKPDEIEGEAEELPPDPADQPEPVAVTVTEEAQVFEAMAVEDERLIMAELEGRALDVMVYSFSIDGKKQTGLSWKGVGETVRTFNNRHPSTAIELDPNIPPIVTDATVPMQIREDGTIDEQYREAPAVQVIVYARNRGAGGGNWGMGLQPKAQKLKRKDDRGEFILKPDPFAAHKALSKAQRNAMEVLLPIEFVEAVKAAYVQGGKVKRIPGATGVAVDVAKRPPALTDEKAKALTREVQRAFDRLRELNPRTMPPGMYANRLNAAHHSHEELEALRDAITDLADTESAIQAIEVEADPVLFGEAMKTAPRGAPRAEILDHLKAELAKGETDGK